MVTPYDFNEAIQHRAEYVEERLREGSPVVGLKCREGLLLLSTRRTQRKVFEIYDRLMMSAIGNQADVEAVRIAALDFAHHEGFVRSPDDVTVNRIVGFALSPSLKKAFGDTWNAPPVFRGVFAEMGRAPEADRFATLNYDGEFAYTPGFAMAAGTHVAEDAMRERLERAGLDLSLEDALRAAGEAWAIGSHAASASDAAEDEKVPEEPPFDPMESLRIHLQNATLEAALLDRAIPRDSKFRALTDRETAFLTG